MTIAQQNSGTFTAASGFTATLPSASSGSSRVVVCVVGNTIITPPGGMTSRAPQVAGMGHYVFDAAGGASSWAFTASPSGHGSWHVFEVVSGAYVTSAGQNTLNTTTYTTPSITPAAGDVELIASMGYINDTGASTVASWLNSFTEEIETNTSATAEFIVASTARRAVTANGSTGYSTGSTVSVGALAGTAIIAAYSTGTTSPWLNRSQGSTANSTTQTATFTAATAGSFLVVIMGGGTTHTEPAGWTERLSPVGYTELSVFTKVAAGGETSMTTTGSAADEQIYVAYEFPSGTTWSGTAAGTATTTTQPTVTSLPGTAVTVFGAFCTSILNPAQGPAASWTGSYIEDVDVVLPNADDAYLTVGYADGITATSAQPTVTLSNTQTTARATNVGERVTFALAVPTTGPPTVGAGADVTNHVVSTALARTASETLNGGTASARAWSITSGPTGVGTTIGTAAALSWTPTVTGTYVLQYSLTTNLGTGTDTVSVVVGNAATSWVNRSVGIAPQNATTSHTVTFTAASTGNLLVATMAGGVTSTTPSGWTLHTSSVAGSGLYVWTKTATAAESSFSTTHNASNYPCEWTVYEFPSGSTMVGSSTPRTMVNDSIFPQITGLPGTTTTVFGIADNSAGSDFTASITATAPWVENYDNYATASAADRVWLGVLYQDGITATTATPTGTISVTLSLGERITIAVSVPASGPPTVGAGADVTEHQAGTEFARTATENLNGGTASARAWSITSGPAGVGNTIGTAAALSWTPTVTGTYVLQYSLTTNLGTGTDSVSVVVVNRVPADLTHIAGAWVAPASSAAVAPAYPAGLAEGDCVYAELHIKPNTATVATPTNWTLVGAYTGGTGTQGAGTGATRIHIYKRLVPIGGLTGTQSFTITGGSSPVGGMRAWHATGTNPVFTEALTGYSRTASNTTYGGTGAAALAIDAKDAVIAVVGATDDQPATITISAITATGITFATLVQSPAGRVINAQGNDISAAAAYVIATAGSATVAPVVTATGGTAETGVGLIYRVHAIVDAEATPTVVGGRDRPAVNSGTVVLDVVATPPGGQTITGHSWVVTSGGGSLTSATTATPTYTAPASGTGLAVLTDTVTASGGGTAQASVTVGFGANIVAAENTLTGTARATWDLTDPNLGGATTLQGFADGFTVNRDATINFKIAQSDAAGWSADVYRLGYYAGNGARLIDQLTPSGGQVTTSQGQPTPGDADAVTTLLSADCGNWSTSLTWTPPAWAPSGIYILRLNRTGGGASHAMFILRDDARVSQLMLMPADSTWHAYNAFGGMGGSLYGGNSLYYGTAIDQYNGDCARFVSYNRPFVNRGAADTGRTYGAVEWSTFFTGEYPMVRFLERNGIDVKYYGCIDAAGDATGAKLTGKTSAVMMVGHNEYWSDGMRAGWEAAKAAGVSIFSCASNEVFWRMVGSNNDASSRPRTFECYKSTIAGRGSTGRAEWTGTWRDPDGAGKGGDNPENLLTGTIFVVNGPQLNSLIVPFNGGYSAQPAWRNTTVAALTAGQSYTSPNQILGFEWDTYGPAGTTSSSSAASIAAPHPLARYCSNAAHAIGSGLLLTDAGDVYDAAGTATHRLVAHPGGANQLCFGTGSINWALGVDGSNTYQVGNDNTDVAIQQATINVLRDMGVTATTLMGGLTAPSVVVWFIAGAAALTSSSTLTVGGVTVKVAAAPLTSSSTLTVGGVTVKVAAAPLTSTSTLAAAATRAAVSTATLSSTTTLTGAATRVAVSTMPLTAASTLLAGGVQVQPAAATLASASTLTADAVRVWIGESTFTSTSTLTAAATRVAVSVATLDSATTLAAEAVKAQIAAVALSAASGLITTAMRTAVASVALSSTTAVSAAALREAVSAAALTVTTSLATTAVAEQFTAAGFSSSSTLTAAATAAGSTAVTFTSATTLTVGVLRATFAAVILTSTSTVAAVREQAAAAALLSTSSVTVGAVRIAVTAAPLTSTSTLAAAAVRVRLGVVGLSSTSTLTVVAVRIRPAEVSLTATSTLAGVSLRTAGATAGLASTSSITAVAAVLRFAVVSMTAQSALSVSPVVGTFVGLISTTAVTVSGLRIALSAAAMASNASLSVAVVLGRLGAAILSGSSSLTAGPLVTRFAAAVFVAASAITVIAERLRAAAVVLSSLTTLTSGSVRVRVGDTALPATSVFLIDAQPFRPGEAQLTAQSTLATVSLAELQAAAALQSLSVLVTGALVYTIGGSVVLQAFLAPRRQVGGLPPRGSSTTLGPRRSAGLLVDQMLIGV